MRKLLFILFFVVISCSSSKVKETDYISVKDLSDTNYQGFASPNSYYLDMGMHKFQMNDSEVIYDRLGGKFGLRNTKTNQIIKTDYSYLAFLNEDYLIVEKDYLKGIIDSQGNVVIPPIYREINLQDAGTPFFIANKEGKFGFLNSDGTELYPFSIRTINSINRYKNKFYIATGDENYNARLLKIANGSVESIGSFIRFTVLNTNLAALYYTNNSRALFGIYNMETDTILHSFGGYYFHKPKNEVWVMSKKSNYQYYDNVIDSTFTLRENAIKNTVKIENDYFFIDTEKGVQILNLEGKPLPFTYPKIESYKRDVYEYVAIYGKEYADYQKELFKFYINKDSKKYGIINSKGTVIVEAEKYDYINYSDLANFNSYNKNLLPYRKEYLIAQNLDKAFFARNYYSDTTAGKTTLFKEDGRELISITVEKGEDCYLELSQISTHGHLMAKCSETMKIYDLASKKMVLEIKESMGYENFKQRDSSGYYYFTFTEPKRTTINYLSNKLKLLYADNMASDSIYYKLIKGDKVYFKKDNKVGLIDFDENIIVPTDYDKIDIFHADFNLVRKDGKYGVISNSNKIIIEIIYDKIIYNVSSQSFDCYLGEKKEEYYLRELKGN